MKKAPLLLLTIIGIVLVIGYRPVISSDILKSEYTTADSRFVSVLGMDVHYFKKGSGYPLLLIHGTSSSSHTWSQWEEILSQHFTTYSMDLPGAGLTDPQPNDDYSSKAFVEFLDAFTTALELDSFYVAGNSLGGKIAWKYASQRHNVKKLVLVDPSGFDTPDRKVPLVFKLGRNKYLAKVIEYVNVSPFVTTSLKEVFYNDDLLDKSLVTRYNRLMRHQGNRRAFFQMASVEEESDISELASITCPTLILWGREDPWITSDLSTIYSTNIPKNQLIIYDECGHIPQEEIPEKSGIDVLNFLLSPVTTNE